MSTQVIDQRAAASSAAARWSRLPFGRWGLRATAVVYLGIGVLLPIIAVLLQGYGDGFGKLRSALATPGAIEAIRLTLIMAALCTVINAVFGTLLAYVLVRYRFPGRNFLSAIVDLPFAIPTLVTGVMLVALYGPSSPIGGFLKDHGIGVVFAPLGILVALLFVTLPFVIRTVQPVLSELMLLRRRPPIRWGQAGERRSARSFFQPCDLRSRPGLCWCSRGRSGNSVQWFWLPAICRARR